VIENLNVKGMVKNHKLARSIIGAGFGYLRQQIKYKAELRNCELVIADRFFPSSKTCSNF
jgi:putative transposase